MSYNDDIETIRRRINQIESSILAVTGRNGQTRAGRRYVGKIYSGGSLPTAANRFYLTHPVTSISGTETENGTATINVETSVSVPVLVLDGPMAVDDYVIADLVNGIWVAEEGQATGSGTPTGSLPGCICATPPASLTLTATGCSGLIDSCTIVYGPTPSGFVSQMGASSYLSTATFTDSLGYDYYWYLNCFSSTIRLQPAYPSYYLGSYWIEAVFYYWTIGLPGNTCSPFSLTNGTPTLGLPPGCSATLTG